MMCDATRSSSTVTRERDAFERSLSDFQVNYKGFMVIFLGFKHSESLLTPGLRGRSAGTAGSNAGSTPRTGRGTCCWQGCGGAEGGGGGVEAGGEDDEG